jgi:hypothetical protein
MDVMGIEMTTALERWAGRALEWNCCVTELEDRDGRYAVI